MSREWLIQMGCLYGPVLIAVLLAVALKPERRFATGLFFSSCWIAVLLPWLDAAARAGGFWHYETSGPRLGGMPLSLHLAWVITWGTLAPLLNRALGGRLLITAVLFLLLDLRVMPELAPVVRLGRHWQLAEIPLILILLVPAIWLAEATAARRHTPIRAAMLVPCFGGLILGIPALIENEPLDLLQQLSPLWLLAGLLLATPGIAAVRDLARSGDGTPVPLDPPRRLVTHGIYGFCRNPMQISMTALLLLEAAFLGSPWPIALAVLGVIYSEGFARWSEGLDMQKRFGSDWLAYRSAVRPWLPRWTPAPADGCELWLDLGCGPCSSVAHWFRNRRCYGLRLHDARDWSGEPLERITWRHPASGRTEQGVAAIAMALQHLTLPWALLGWFAQLPVLAPLLQICLDTAGTAPRSAGRRNPLDELR